MSHSERFSIIKSHPIVFGVTSMTYYTKSNHWAGFNTRGTGFFVKTKKEKFLFTARHNFDGNSRDIIGPILCKLFIPQEPMFLYSGIPNYNPDEKLCVKFSLIDVNLDRTNPSNDDLLILKVIDNPPEDKYCFELDDLVNISPEDSQEYYLIGYPKEKFEENTELSAEAHVVHPIILELSLRSINNSRIDFATKQQEIKNLSGFSGGPIVVYNSKNKSLKLRAMALSTGLFPELDAMRVVGMLLFEYLNITTE